MLTLEVIVKILNLNIEYVIIEYLRDTKILMISNPNYNISLHYVKKHEICVHYILVTWLKS